MQTIIGEGFFPSTFFIDGQAILEASTNEGQGLRA